MLYELSFFYNCYFVFWGIFTNKLVDQQIKLYLHNIHKKHNNTNNNNTNIINSYYKNQI